MKTKYLVIGLVLVLAVVTGVLIYQGRDVQNTAQNVVTTVTEDVTIPGQPSGPGTSSSSAGSQSSAQQSAGGSAGPASSESSAASAPSSSAAGPDAGKKSNVPMTKLKAGEKAPQFIIFSFDGAGSHAKWQEFMDTAQPHDARFTGFLTGLYLLTDENKMKYKGPGHSAGKSSVGFGGTDQEVATLIGDLNEAKRRGYEIGTHFNGHFCSGAEPSGAMWSTDQWIDEMTQFHGFLADYRKNNPGVQLPELTVTADDIKGGRTQCLEGKFETLLPMWKKFGFTYDTSLNDPRSGLNWPVRKSGVWEFYMPYVYTPSFPKGVINMDYNMWVTYNGGKNDPSSTEDLRKKVYDNYVYLYDKALAGNRAPILVANHFNNWNGNSFNPAVAKFMADYCGKPDTICATYTDVVAWMELQDPAVLEKIQDQAAVAATKLT